MAKKKRAARRAKPVRKVDPDQLPAAELEVLAVLWNTGGTTAGEIRDQLSAYRPMAHGSVLTLLQRLSAKGLVTREKSKQGKAYFFKPTVGRDMGHKRLVNRMTERVFGGDPVSLIGAVVSSQIKSAEQVRQVKKLLDGSRR
jgi:predicted transcriptional regulator